jgi:ComF family protein
MGRFFRNCCQEFFNILFPKSCLFCQKEGSFLCEDCQATFEILEQDFCLCKKPKILLSPGKCKNCQPRKLQGLYFSFFYDENPKIKRLIKTFKYEPCLKELAKPLASLLTRYLLLKERVPGFPHLAFVLEKDRGQQKTKIALIPIPLDKQRLRWRGFNQAEELAKLLGVQFEIPLIPDCLLKIKKTLPQKELSEKQRRENLKNVFLVRDKEKIRGKKIFLIDDIYTTGATMEEAAKVLRKAGAKEVWGLVIARSTRV